MTEAELEAIEMLANEGRWPTVTDEQVKALVAEVRRLRAAGKSCPCRWTTPCCEGCTCANPLSSVGCRRCCAYGSDEQRKAMAVQLVTDNEALLLVARAAKQYMKSRLDKYAYDLRISLDALAALRPGLLDEPKKTP